MRVIRDLSASDIPAAVCLASTPANRVDYRVLSRDTMLSPLNLFSTFIKIGLFSFGAAASAVVMEFVVGRKQWLTLEEFRDNISLAALMPGPFHVNLVGLTGYAISGYIGCLLAVIGFVIPGFTLAVLLAVTLSSETLSRFLIENPGVVRGMLVAVGGLLLNVIAKLGQHTLPSPHYWIGAAALAILLLIMQIHFAVVILGAGLLHMLYVKAKSVS